jgi:hypothetical protein
MKSISAALAQHLAGEVATLATCWQITRRDGVALGFTDHVRDLVVDSVTFNAASGYTRMAIRGTADLAVDNLDVESVFSDDGIPRGPAGGQVRLRRCPDVPRELPGSRPGHLEAPARLAR